MQLLSISYPQTLLQNVIYALPARRTLLFSDGAGAAFDVATEETMAVHIGPLTLVDGMHDMAGAFIRCTSGDVRVALKPI